MEIDTRRVPRRPAVPALAVATAMLVAVGLVAVLAPPAPGRDTPTAAPRPVPLEPPTRAVFSTSTGDTLIVDEGPDGLVALDLDRGLARRFTYPDKISGMALTRVGDRLLFPAPGRVESVPLTLSGAPQSIGTDAVATFVPAGDSNRLWLVFGAASTGGHAELAALDGGSLAGAPTVAVPPGVAVVAGGVDRVLTESSASALSWLVAGRSEPVALLDASVCLSSVVQRGGTVVVGAPATPTPTCNRVQRLGPDGALSPAVPIPEVDRVRPRAISPNGEKVVVAGVGDQGGDGGQWLVELATGSADVLDPLPAAATSIVTWSTDGQRLFTLATHDGGTWLGLYDIARDHFEEHPAPVGSVAAATAVATAGTADERPAAMLTVPSGAGPDLAATASECVAPVPAPGDPRPLPAVQATSCRLPETPGHRPG